MMFPALVELSNDTIPCNVARQTLISSYQRDDAGTPEISEIF